MQPPNPKRTWQLVSYLLGNLDLVILFIRKKTQFSLEQPIQKESYKNKKLSLINIKIIDILFAGVYKMQKAFRKSRMREDEFQSLLI